MPQTTLPFVTAGHDLAMTVHAAMQLRGCERAVMPVSNILLERGANTNLPGGITVLEENVISARCLSNHDSCYIVSCIGTVPLFRLAGTAGEASYNPHLSGPMAHVSRPALYLGRDDCIHAAWKHADSPCLTLLYPASPICISPHSVIVLCARSANPSRGEAA